MIRDFGQKRVKEPRGYFPVSAWALNNDRKINSCELRISVERIKIEEANFRQLCNSCDYDIEKIKERIINIVDRRGKLHNQLTDSGGICIGTVEAIGDKYDNSLNLKVGDRVVGIASLTSIPLHIDKVKNINFNYGQIEVEGYGIFFSASPIIPMPDNIPEEILLCAYDESGSIAKAGEIAKSGSRFLILGSNILTVLIYAASMKFSCPVACNVTACLDLDPMSILTYNQVKKPLSPYVDDLYITSANSPMENYIDIEKSNRYTRDGNFFDSSVICSNMLGIEAIGVLFTKNKGNLFFTNLINNYNLTILLAESLGKNLNTISLEEYTSEFPVYTVSLLKRIKESLLNVHNIYKKNNIVNRFPSTFASNFSLKNINIVDGYAFKSLVTKEMLDNVLNIATYDCNVLILGETGVGKERILDIIHKNSSRNGNRCVKINCSAIAENLAESEFFGYEEGAFTGAKNTGKKGFFELANNGILFLDEVGDLPLSIQAKLLRVLQEGQFYRVGGETPVNVNVRVVCATNKSLRRLIEEGKFREDLYYRLNICEIEIPPLRDRIEDIEPMVEMFARKYNDQYMIDKAFTIEAFDTLKAYSWPGNVRELDNIVHKLLINTRGKIIDDSAVKRIIKESLRKMGEKDTSADSADVDFNETINTDQSALDSIMGKHERAVIQEALQKYGTTRNAAEALGISQSQLMRKKKKYNL